MTELAQYQIVVIRPKGYVHSGAFMEVAETLLHAFKRLGFRATLTENRLSKEAVNIVIGVNLIPESIVSQIPPNTILYNFEQLSASSPWMTPAMATLFGRFQVWDYSSRNIQYLENQGLSRDVIHVPIGYVPEMSRIDSERDQDIDVLFYGSINPRRKKILDALQEENLHVVSLTDVYGSDRDQYIARSKIVINIHFYEEKIFELVRVSYLLANKKAVVSECDEDTEIEMDLRDAIALAPYDELVSACKRLLDSRELRVGLENRALEVIRKRDQCAILLEAGVGKVDVENEHKDTTMSDNIVYPKKINMGSGKDFKQDYLNIDLSDHWNPDIVMDFSDVSVVGKTFQTSRFSDVILAPDVFDEIISNDVLEHIPELVLAMTNCLRLLKNGGEFKINVPYDLSYGAWQDPTHVRAFNERSWLYYTDWFWYLGWKEARFDLKNLDYTLSPMGVKLKEQGVDEDTLTSTPRAIDSMSVTLRKRSLTPVEVEFVDKVSSPS